MSIGKKTYCIKKVVLKSNDLSEVWNDIKGISIDNFPWDKNGYKPKTIAKVFYTDTHFHIYFRSYENEIKVTYFDMDGDVYKDSCVEFFVKFNPDKDKNYLNFEMNPAGTLLLGFGPDRHKRNRLNFDNFLEVFNVSTSVTKDTVDEYNNSSQYCSDKFWTVQYSIPFSFIEKYFGKLDFKKGYRLEGNFYKCGDETKYPHYGCWNLIDLPASDFHRPDFFGNLILE